MSFYLFDKLKVGCFVVYFFTALLAESKKLLIFAAALRGNTFFTKFCRDKNKKKVLEI